MFGNFTRYSPRSISQSLAVIGYACNVELFSALHALTATLTPQDHGMYCVTSFCVTFAAKVLQNEVEWECLAAT